MMRERGWMMVVGVALAACGSDGAAPPTGDPLPAELVATWYADTTCLPQCGFTFSAVSNPAATLNVVAAPYRFEFELEISQNGQARLTSRPGTTDRGTIRRVGTLLIMQSTAGTDTLEYVLAGQTLQLRYRREVVQFDLTGDGVADPATVAATFRRR
jgi:hypothetical protein